MMASYGSRNTSSARGCGFFMGESEVLPKAVSFCSGRTSSAVCYPLCKPVGRSVIASAQILSNFY